LILDRIGQADCANGFLFDGGIRTVGQADLCVENSIEFTHVIEIKVDDNVIIDRMSGRRVHPGSGETIILYINHLKMMALMILPENLLYKEKMICPKQSNIACKYIKMKPNHLLLTINLKKAKAPLSISLWMALNM
jgi:adenylate kinase family enzyme